MRNYYCKYENSVEIPIHRIGAIYQIPKSIWEGEPENLFYNKTSFKYTQKNVLTNKGEKKQNHIICSNYYGKCIEKCKNKSKKCTQMCKKEENKYINKMCKNNRKIFLCEEGWEKKLNTINI